MLPHNLSLSHQPPPPDACARGDLPERGDLSDDPTDFADENAENNIVLSRYSNQQSVRFGVRVGTTWEKAIGGTIVDDAWTHLVATADGNRTLRLYQDGALVGEETLGHAPPALNRTNHWLGRSDTGNYWAGALGSLHAWARALHGCVDLELTISIKLPIPTWLLPLAFVRWVLVKLIKVFYPYLLLVNERFGTTPFAPRVQEDAHGFYARLRSTLRDAARPWRKQGGADAVNFVI